MAFLLTMRAVQGIAAAGLNFLAFAIVRDRYKGDENALIQSRISAVFLATPVLAPAAGQLLLIVATWRFLFIVLAPIGALLGAVDLFAPARIAGPRGSPAGCRGRARRGDVQNLPHPGGDRQHRRRHVRHRRFRRVHPFDRADRVGELAARRRPWAERQAAPSESVTTMQAHRGPRAGQERIRRADRGADGVERARHRRHAAGACPRSARRSASPRRIGASWSITVYLLGFGASQIFYGPLADRFGRKPLLIGCMIFYALFGALAGLAGELRPAARRALPAGRGGGGDAGAGRLDRPRPLSRARRWRRSCRW